MARIRTIKPEFWTSEQVMECSVMARLLFIGLWNFCDDAGNHPASARTIKAEIFPADDISTDDVSRLLYELSSNGLIVLYAAQGKDYWHVTGWNHQKIDKPTFKYPEFQESTPRALDDSSPPEGKGRERKGKEGSNTVVVGNSGDNSTKTKPVIYTQFQMHEDWTPSASFDSLAKSAGLVLQDTPVAAMKEFRTYWITQPNMRRTSGEWDHAFIRQLIANKLKPARGKPPSKPNIAANSLYDPTDTQTATGGHHAALK